MDDTDLEAILDSAAADFTILPSAAGHAKSKNANAADLSCESKNSSVTDFTVISHNIDNNEQLLSSFTDNCKVSETKKSVTLNEKQPEASKCSSEQVSGALPLNQEEMFKELFGEDFTKEISKEFEEAFKSLSEADMLNTSATSSSPEVDKINKTIQETVQKMAENANDAETEMSDEEFAKMFSSMGGDMGDGFNEASFMPMMQQMMKQLLSKDILYPSLKEIALKYPDWLNANAGKLPKNELANYRSQYEIMCQICEQYESEKDSDSQQTTSARFDTILNLMQRMQDFGQPPKEIVATMAPGMELDEEGLPKFPFPTGASPDQCALM